MSTAATMAKDSGSPSEDELVTSIVDHVVQNPKFGFDPNEKWSEEELERLVHIATDKLLDKSDPLFAIVHLQAEFDLHYQRPTDVLKRSKTRRNRNLVPLVQEICESHPRVRTNLEYVHEKIAQYIVLKSGLGNADKSMSSLREIRLILRSVFPLKNVQVFGLQSLLDKRLQLKELCQVVTGIRIFNWDTQSGGDGAALENVPALSIRESERVLDDIGAMRMYAQDKTTRYTALCEAIYLGPACHCVTDKEAYCIKFGLALLRQFVLYLTILWEDAKMSMQRVSRLDEDFTARLEVLRLTLAQAGSVPTVQIFPRFINLAQTWHHFEQEFKVVHHIKALVARLHGHTHCLRPIPVVELIQRCSVATIPTDEARLEVDLNDQISDKKFKLCRHHPWNEVNSESSPPIQLVGFCPVALAIGNGVLLPGLPRLGSIEYEGKRYEFSTVERAQQFGRNPDIVMEALQRIWRESPMFLKLLDWSEPRSTQTPAQPTGRDATVQTPVHYDRGWKDPGYQWNEWVMRQQAVQLIGLRSKVTHASQTWDSACRASRGTQVPGPQANQATEVTQTESRAT